MKQGMGSERAERHRERTAGRGAGEESRTKEKPPTTGRLGDVRRERERGRSTFARRLQLSNRVAQPERTPCDSDCFLPVLLLTQGALLNGEALANAVDHRAQAGA